MAETAFREATAKESDDALLIRKLANEGLLRRSPPRHPSERYRMDFRLHGGEADTIALAWDMAGIAGTDDGPALRCLKILGIPFTTAIALLVALVEEGGVDPMLGLELVSKLARYGRYNTRILEDASRRIRARAHAGGGGQK
jgi:predicted nucleic acid-binding protein